MDLLDFVYYIGYQAYVRGNKTENGSFFINTLWLSLFQFMLLFIIMTITELLILRKIFSLFENTIFFIFFILMLVLVNNIYLSLGKRKEKILNRNQLPINDQKKYWIIFSIVFFAVFILGGIFANLRKEILG